MLQESAVMVSMAVVAAKAPYKHQGGGSTTDAVAQKTVSNRGPERVTALQREVLCGEAGWRDT